MIWTGSVHSARPRMLTSIHALTSAHIPARYSVAVSTVTPSCKRTHPTLPERAKSNGSSLTRMRRADAAEVHGQGPRQRGAGELADRRAGERHQHEQGGKHRLPSLRKRPKERGRRTLSYAHKAQQSPLPLPHRGARSPS
eukprot:2148164-Pleurochrysis_carterae.AAC.2